jgi:hypothetical protein
VHWKRERVQCDKQKSTTDSHGVLLVRNLQALQMELLAMDRKCLVVRTGADSERRFYGRGFGLARLGWA